ncbi:MAG: hypothetical protein FWC58_07225 [Desulfobulbus sp.]|nr:hypothetical protein [Desulfobulbus sp.]
MNQIKLPILWFLLFAGWGMIAQAADTSRPATPDEIQSITATLKDALDSVTVSGIRISANGKVACGFVSGNFVDGKDNVFYARSLGNKGGKPDYILMGREQGRNTAVTAECQKAGINVYQ